MIKKSDFFAFFWFFGYNKVEFIYNYTFMVEKENNWEFSENTKEKYWKLHDKTNTINNETDKIERHKHDFMNFCGQKRSLKKVRPGRTKLLSENSEQYASIQCKSWDCPEDETERNELRLERGNSENKNDDFEFNKPYNYKFSFRIPENFPLYPTRLVIWQWKYNKLEGSDEKKDPSPILAQRIKKINWEYYFIITDWIEERNILWKIPFNKIKGKWVDMDYELRFSDKKDENNNPIPCTAKIKAKIEWKWEKEIYNWKFDLAKENNLQFNSEQSHTWYFKFGLYRNNYDYAREEIEKDDKLSNEEKSIRITEIERAKNSENKNPMEIHFKNFSMEDLTYKEFEQEKQQSKNKLLSRIKKLIGKL